MMPVMLIGGLQKTTLLDYPDKVAATIFTIGCNFRCSFCHNPEIVNGIAKVMPTILQTGQTKTATLIRTNSRTMT